MSSTKFEQSQVEAVERIQAKTQVYDKNVVENPVQAKRAAEGAPVVNPQIFYTETENHEAVSKSTNTTVWRSEIEQVCIVHFAAGMPLTFIFRSTDICGRHRIQKTEMSIQDWLSGALMRRRKGPGHLVKRFSLQCKQPSYTHARTVLMHTSDPKARKRAEQNERYTTQSSYRRSISSSTISPYKRMEISSSRKRSAPCSSSAIQM